MLFIIIGIWIKRIREGDYFGEIALLSKSNKRTASVKTVTYSDIFYISKQDFD
jgi:CRP-like cAMP-binding protein